MFKPKLFEELKNYNREKATADIFAGVTVGIVALPLAMAFAIASNLPPARGIYTAIVAGFLISALGGSKVQIGGPTGAFVVMVSSILAQFGYPGLAMCTFMAGFMLILFGLFRMGGLIKFIPFPVITGFTTGIAVIIFSTQIRDLFGLNMKEVPSEFIPKWIAYFHSMQTLNIEATMVGIGTIVIIVLVRKWWPKLPSMLIGMLIATLAVHFLHLDIATIGSRFGDLPRSLPSPSFPQINFSLMQEYFKPAFTIAMLAAIESLLSASVADGMIGDRHKPNIELIGQGIANIASIIFGGMPATGAIARTATNVKSGGRSPIAGMIHAITLALMLLLFAPLAKLIPLASLAGILIVVSYNMSEPRHFTSICKGPISDAFVLVLTFLLTILVDLTAAVEVGVVLASLLFMRRMSEISNVGIITKEVRGDFDMDDDPHAIEHREVPDGVEVFEVNGPFFFGMIDSFKNAISNIKKPPVVLVIRIRNVPAVDATAIHVLRHLYFQCRRDGTTLVFSGVHDQPLEAFRKSGFLDKIGKKNFLENIDEALVRASEILEQKRDAASTK